MLLKLPPQLFSSARPEPELTVETRAWTVRSGLRVKTSLDQSPGQPPAWPRPPAWRLTGDWTNRLAARAVIGPLPFGVYRSHKLSHELLLSPAGSFYFSSIISFFFFFFAFVLNLILRTCVRARARATLLTCELWRRDRQKIY